MPAGRTDQMQQTGDIRAYNRYAWDLAVERKSVWTVPVDSETVAAARRGDWRISLTPTRAAPRHWFPVLRGANILCLAGGGGQQAPVLAAAGEAVGARVTVFDNSPRQLAQDSLVADREGLDLAIVEGDMRDLGAFDDGSFNLVVHPCANLFVPDVRPVWRECARVLAEGGVLMAGFVNPVLYLFDQDADSAAAPVVRHKLPYSDLFSIPESERNSYMRAGEALEFGHTLTDQIAGQLDAGLVLTGFYEDRWQGQPPAEFTDTYIATRSVKTDCHK